ncbi:MAG: mechanosensitive ion channel [Gammaproteobacteria bacterium]|nr:mechanosensitive ion channel [Gammaproteobacteria bacterium]MDH4313647.1 mechanosensitive ion channel [Gammaproteobacteria bacterium]MDH5213860.1 mechanosensitive ion channel [Gammaproteobacteria bacterium]MDH5500450.1 mechanosensitive ion channel [Gammaproteobacteria bacterium]
MNDIAIPGLDIDWAKIFSDLQSTGLDLGLNLLAAIVIFYVGRTVARMVTKGVRKVLAAQSVDPILISFVTSLVQWALMAFVIIAAITKLGVQTASLVALIGAAGLAVGLALQGSLANFAAGVLIVLFRPYKVGDYVEAAGVGGSVIQVQVLTTILRTPDNKEIIIPNGQIMNSIITNYNANETRRIDLVVGVSYSDDLDKVREAIKQQVAADERVLKDPECQIAVSELADSSVNFVVRPWVKSQDYWAVKFDLTEAVKKRFDKEGISIPFPQRDLHIYQQSA